MSRYFLRIALAASLVLAASGCSQQSNPAASSGGDTPDGAIRASTQLLKQGDIAGLMQHALPATDFAKLKADWGKDNQPITDEDRQKFAETMTKLTEPGAEQKLYAEFEPQLKQFDAQYQQQMPMWVGMGSAYLQGLVHQSKTLSDAEKQQSLDAIKAIGDWVQKTRFTDPVLVQKALAVVCKTAREINLKTLDEARALNYDQSMQKADLAFAGFKQVLDVYGFSLDQTLDSVKPEVVSNDGNAATVKVGYTLFGAPLVAETRMVKVDGRWYGKDTIEKLRKAEQQPVAPATAAPAPAAPAPPPVPAPQN